MPYPCFRRLSIFVSFVYLSFLFLFPSVYALYEEDAGKFDWHKSLLGPVCHARFEGNFLLLASSYGAVAVASASNSDGSLLWRQVIPLAAPVSLPVRDGGTMDNKDKPAVKVLELVLHPQKRLVMALTRDPSTAALGVWAWRLFDGNLMWHVTVPASGVPLGKRVKAKEGGFLALFPDTVGAVDGETGEIYFLSAVDGTRIWKAPAVELMAVTGVVPVDGGIEKGVVVVGEGSDGKAQAFLVRLGGEKAEKIKSVSFSDGGLISHGAPSLYAFARPAPARSLALLLLSPPSSSSLSAADMQLVNPSGAKANPHGVLSSPIPSSHPSSPSASCLVLSDSGAVVEITLTQGKVVQRLVAPPSPSLPLAFRAGPYVLRGEENQGPGVEVFRVVDGQSVGRVTLRGRRSLRGLWAGMRGGWREEEKEGRESDLFVLTVDKAETLVLQTMDDCLVWLREECLADVAQVLIVDHRPPAEGEKRSGTEEVTEALATSPLFEKLLSVVLPPSPSSSSVRDPHFGLTKIVLFLCAPSSRLIALLSSHGGTVLWTRDLPSVEGREGARWRMVQQGDEVLLVGEGGEGLATWLDIATGHEVASLPTLGLTPPAPSSSLVLFPIASSSSSSSSPPRLLLVDTRNATGHRARFLDGSSCAQGALGGREAGTEESLGDRPIFYHTLSTPSSGGASLQTYRLFKPSSAPSSPDWPFQSAIVGASSLPSPSERVVSTAYPDVRETMTAPSSHPLGDGALLLKYLNPYLVALASTASLPPSPPPASLNVTRDEGSQEGKRQGGAEGGKEVSTLYVTLMDTVSGRVLYRVSHFHAQGPVRMRLVENWLIYSYWNCKAQRTEIGSITLYDGFIDRKGLGLFTSPEFKERTSSFDGDAAPVALQQTFLFPHPILTLGSTLTARGITTKGLLVGFEPGQILLLDRRLLDPRRPTALPLSKTEKAEGLLPYAPHLPVLPPHVVTYNHTLHGLHSLYTAPSSLESTTLLLGVGDLDLYFTRLYPSHKPFDLLPDTFNHVLVSLVSLISVVGVGFLGKAAQAKALREAWA